MAVILDTDVIIRGERGTLDLSRWLVSQGDEEIQIAAITIAELWHGVERTSSAYRVERQDYIRKMLSLVRSFPTLKRLPLNTPASGRMWSPPAK